MFVFPLPRSYLWAESSEATAFELPEHFQSHRWGKARGKGFLPLAGKSPEAFSGGIMSCLKVGVSEPSAPHPRARSAQRVPRGLTGASEGPALLTLGSWLPGKMCSEESQALLALSKS